MTELHTKDTIHNDCKTGVGNMYWQYQLCTPPVSFSLFLS